MNQLSIAANLTLDHGGRLIHVRASGSNVIVEVPDLRSAHRLVRSARYIGLPRSRFGRIARSLRDSGLAVTLRTPRRRLFTFGDTRESLWLRLLGYPSTSLHFK